MAAISMTTGTEDATNYTIEYNLLLDGGIIASETIKMAFTLGTDTQNIIELPSMTWIDAPSAGPHTYRIDVTITGTIISPSSAITRALNIVTLG